MVVVGGGAIGLCCAWRLAQSGAETVVLDRAEPPAGATRVAAGMLAPIGELAFGEPELLRMTIAAAEIYPDFVAELEAASGLGSGYVSHGALHIALDRDEAAELRRVHDLQRSLGLGAEWLPPRRCRELEPGLTPSFNGGVHAPDEAAIDPRRMTAALLAALAAAGRRGAQRRRRGRADARRRAARKVCARGRARSCGPTTSSSPPAPGRARRAGCRSRPGPRCARSRARSSSCALPMASRPASGSSPPSGSTWCRVPTAA